ncbi:MULTISPECIES: hypothetical protein [Sphingomonas]|uniref:hypothetical protein n=1 Tax=Sphingomonas TaxID=13687 RepID=UPI001F382325|nr:hypothetical protein [Sphingomonas cannabina]UIJ47241.1 hypothetical protein LZK98_09995 [Sphingomonas cannabina]
MTDIAETPPAVRIARVIAAAALSPNAEGPQGSERPVSDAVDDAWRLEVDRARAILRTLREPTRTMVAAGNAARGDAAEVWSAMVRAAIEEEESAEGIAL